MRTIEVTELEDLGIQDLESADRISAVFGQRRGGDENLLLHTCVLVWEGADQRHGAQEGKPYLVMLEFSNTELYRRFGLLWLWEQRYLVRAVLGKLNEPGATGLKPSPKRTIEVGVPWRATTRRRISVEMWGVQSVGDNTEPRIGFVLRIGLV